MALDFSRGGTSRQLEDVIEEENLSKQLTVSEEDDVNYYSLPTSQIDVNAIALHPEKFFIAIGTLCGKVVLWDLNQFKQVTEFKFLDKKVYGIKWNSKGTELAVGTSIGLGVLHFVNTKFDNVLTTVTETNFSVWDSQFKWNASGTHLVFCRNDPIFIYSEETKKTKSKRGNTFFWDAKIVWQNDELFTLMLSETFFFFNTDLNEMGNIFKVKACSITALDWNRSGDLLAYASTDLDQQFDVKVWQSSTRKFCPGWENNQQSDKIQKVKWLNSSNALDGENGIVLASISHSELKLWKKDGACSVIHKIGNCLVGFSPSALFFVVRNEIKETMTNDLVKKFNGSGFSWNLKENLFAFQKSFASEDKIGIIKLQIKTSDRDGGGAPLPVLSGSQDDANGPPSLPQLQQSQQQSIDLAEKFMRTPLMDGHTQKENILTGEQNLQLFLT